MIYSTVECAIQLKRILFYTVSYLLVAEYTLTITKSVTQCEYYYDEFSLPASDKNTAHNFLSK